MFSKLMIPIQRDKNYMTKNSRESKKNQFIKTIYDFILKIFCRSNTV
jgi:hypothetical protein